MSYTSDPDGITVGVEADSFVEALSALVDEFGEGVVPLYENTRSQFQELADSVDSIVYGERDATTTEPTRSDAAQAAEGGTGDLPPDKADNGDPGRTGDAAEASPGGGTDPEHEGLRDALESVVTADQPEQHECAICGAPITRDRAKATTLMQGEPRCDDCTP